MRAQVIPARLSGKLSDQPTPFGIAVARRFVRGWRGPIELAVTVQPGRCCLWAVGRRTAARFLSQAARRNASVCLAEVLGSLVIGE